MTVPTYDEFIEPLLRVLVAHPAGIRAPEAHALVAAAVGLGEDDRAQMLPSGRQAVYKNRIGWAHDRLKRAGYSSSPRRAWWTVTPEGIAFALAHPVVIAPEIIESLAHVGPDSRLQPDASEGAVIEELASVGSPPQLAVASPEERIDAAVKELHDSVAGDLLDLIAANTPAFFEQLVLDFLHALGYGTDPDALHRVGKSGDGGIDGIISLDRLGFEKVYVQAKRWQGSVGRPEIQGFFGALAGHRASKGVFITTSTFTKEAREYAARVSDSLVLVDGPRLTSLMIAHGVGVSHSVVKLAKIDSDYFEDV
jgi:restriction system protein